MATTVEEFVRRQTQTVLDQQEGAPSADIDDFVRRQTTSVIQQQAETPQAPSIEDFVNRQLQSGVPKQIGEQKPKAFVPSKVLKTPFGLELAAKQVGEEERAKDILESKGEKNAFLGGGFITDFFDILNAAQYGVVGLLKGKGFAEGVRTRESFTKEDSLGQAGVPGFVVGLALDIAVDPLTYIAPWTIFKKIPGAAKALDTVSSSVAKSRIGEWVGTKLVYRFGQDPVYRALDERRIKNVAVGTQNLLDIARPLSKLDAATQKAIAEARKAGKVEELAPELLAKAKPAFDELDKLSKEAVDVGLLKKEVYDETVGSYIPRLYRKFEKPEEGVAEVFGAKKLRIDLDRFKARKDVPDDVREAMGEVLEAGYPTAKGLVQLKSAVENAKFFREVNAKFGREAAEAGLTKLPETKALGELAGRYVPKPIADSINEMTRARSEWEKFQRPIVYGFKYGKVILNPATHARNVGSNMVLNSFEGMRLEDPRTWLAYGEASKELATNGKWYKEAKDAGLGLNTFAAAELKGFLDAPEMKSLGSKARELLDRIADVYQKEEEFAKLSQYIFQRKYVGLAPEQAWEVAERATFNYAQVTPFIRHIRESIFGFPFITFTYKATPQAVKALGTRSTAISNIGKLKNAIENQANPKELERERASEPQWVRDGFYLKIPVKDKLGRSLYFDLTYILPFGDLVSGQYFSRQVKRETGLPETIPEAAFEKTPFWNVVKELARNQDFYGNKIVKESAETGEQGKDIMTYLLKTYLPPAVGDQLPGGYRADGEKRPPLRERIATPEKQVETGGAQGRTLMEELLRQVGVKLNPVDIETQEKYMTSEKKKALEQLLLEEGVGREFEQFYLPKQ